MESSGQRDRWRLGVGPLSLNNYNRHLKQVKSTATSTEQHPNEIKLPTTDQLPPYSTRNGLSRELIMDVNIFGRQILA